MTIRAWLRLWFTFEERVGRREYLLSGAVLAVVKYATDALLVAVLAGRLWTPLDYVRPLRDVLADRLTLAHPSLLLVLGAWTLPFLWIAVTMTMRRALDAGRSAWWALVVFVPWLRFPLMLLLGVLPSRALAAHRVSRPRPHERRLPSALLAIAAGAGLALAMIWLGVYMMRSYGAALFLGMPFVVGAVTAWLLNRRYAASARETTEVVLFTIACVGGLLLLIALEGVICLAMAAPLAIVLALGGGEVGRRIAERDGGSGAQTAMAMLVLPLSALLEVGDSQRAAGGAEPALREVRSAIVIDATPEAVWDAVIEFPPLPPPTALTFRLGIAYPVSARLEGRGVGAIRYCEFSTGAFVEPITTWEPGVRLGFDVADHPPPLAEWSPYRDVSPPHLEHYFRSRRGEFRLVPLADGRTRLEGSTWYELRIFPDAYWAFWADLLVHRIHDRVLEHIGRTVAARDGTSRR